MYVADQLSRSYLDETEPEDPQMIEDGWPAQISKIPVDVRPYWSHKVSLHVENGILLLDSRIVVPLALRSIMLEKLHAGHSGVPKTVSRAQQSLYWPNYRTDIANFVDSCETCNKFARRKSPAELLQHEIPNQPWILLKEYRATPRSNLNESPAQIHLSRQIKTDVPVLPELLKPKLIHQEVHEKMIAFQAQVKVAHDKRVMRPVKTFQPGDVVNVRSRIDSTWEPGTVVGVCDKPRSYFVRNNRGRVVRRNESHMSLKVPRNKPGLAQDVITDLVHEDEPDVSEPQYVLQMPFDADDQEIDPFDIPAYIFDL
ncbi:hypothetical protein KUF71_002487 [Frankliniella fusca]|uniref:RNA-directed DNA polymerase n=1 Tax=Frankliniella fusca TaxID=407009 RepID=A0AAE1LL48_9NEOP|nr:hypothetical protein KUF71_002487 [Frankliniella fusca]